MRPLFHEEGHAWHEFVHVVLAQVFMVCVAFPLLTQMFYGGQQADRCTEPSISSPWAMKCSNSMSLK